MSAAANPNKLGTRNSARGSKSELTGRSGTELGISVAPLRKVQAVHEISDDRRLYPRLPLQLTVRLKRIAGRPEPEPATMLADDISCSGIHFRSDRPLEPGTPIDLEVLLMENPLGGPNMRMFTMAHVVRMDDAPDSEWHGVAAEFDYISFDRDPQPELSVS